MSTSISPVTILFLSLLSYAKPEHILPFLFACLIHEIGHIAMIHCIKHCRFDFSLSGSGAIITSPSLSYSEMILCAAVGPLCNLVFAAFFSKYPLFCRYSFCLGIYNLLPFSFLDGGSIVSAILHQITDPISAESISKLISCSTGLILFILMLLLCAHPIYLFSSAILLFRACCESP